MPSIKQDVIVLSATRYKLVDKETGEINEGTSVRYMIGDNLMPYAEDDFKGYKVAKARVGVTNFYDFVTVPGVYSADLNINISADGNAKVSASNFVFQHGIYEAQPSQEPKGK